MGVLRYAGFAEESEFAPESPPDAQFHVDKTSSSLDTPSDVQMIYGGGLSRNALRHTPGYYAPTGNVAYGADINTLVHMLKWVLGGYEFEEDYSTVEVTDDNDTIKVIGEDNKFEVDSDANGNKFEFAVPKGAKIEVSGFDNSDNNGTFTVKEATREYIKVEEEDLVDEDAGESVSIDSKKNLHEIYGTTERILPSFTTRLGKDHFEHVFVGCTINSLQLEVEGEFATLTAEVVSAKDSKSDIKETGHKIPTPYLLAFHNVTVTLTDSETGQFVEPNQVKSLSLGVNNNVGEDSGRALGKRHPVRLVAGEREVTADMNLFYQDTKAIEQFWGAEDGPAYTGGKEFSVDISIDSSPYGSVNIYLPACIFTNVDTQPSGRDELEQSVAVRSFVAERELTVTGDTQVTDVVIDIENYHKEVEAD